MVQYSVYESDAQHLGHRSRIPVMVMSTDSGSEISFEDWHDAADAHDDEEGDENNNLTTYRFLLGDEEGNSLGIESPGTTIFVNKTGYITWQGNHHLLMILNSYKSNGISQIWINSRMRHLPKEDQTIPSISRTT